MLNAMSYYIDYVHCSGILTNCLSLLHRVLFFMNKIMFENMTAINEDHFTCSYLHWWHFWLQRGNLKYRKVFHKEYIPLI